MARIRSIKPEFWDDRALAKTVSRDARLLYIALWNQADEWGRLQGDPSWVKGRAFPYDDDLTTDRIVGLLGELEGEWVVQYESEGDPYIYLPKLAKHQRLEPDKVPSRLPEPLDPGGTQPRADEFAPDSDESALLYGAGSRLQGAGGDASDAPPSPFCPKHPSGTESPCRACGNARQARAAWVEAQKHKPTQSPADRVGHCSHPKNRIVNGWCERCGEKA